MKRIAKTFTPAQLERIEQRQDRKHAERNRDQVRRDRLGQKNAEIHMLAMHARGGR